MYYTPEDIQELTQCSKKFAYSLIQKLNAKLEKEYPGTIIVRARIPKWYFEEKMMNTKKEH